MPSLRSRWRCARPLDVAGVGLAVLYGLPSLSYPFGRDQALFDYMGRDLIAGRLPYVTSIDVKPVGIFYLHALGRFLFGGHQWNIRLLDLGALVVMAWLVTKLFRAVAPLPEPRDGQLGTVALLLFGFYYSCFDYWDTAQVELWEALFVVAGWAAARPRSVPRLRALAVGACVAAAASFKPTAALVGVGLFAVCVANALADREHRRRRVADVVVSFTSGIIAAEALILMPFIVTHTLAAFWESNIGLALHYASVSISAGSSHWLALEHGGAWIGLTAGVFVLGLVRARRRDRGWPPLAVAIGALTALSVASIAVQRKFFGYHWVVLTPFVALAGASGLTLGLGGPRRAFVASLVAVTLSFLAAPRWIANPEESYRGHVAKLVRYLDGSIDRWHYLAHFSGPFGYSYRTEERLGDALAYLAAPGDTVCVRGFEPAIYTVSGLRCNSRFPWETFLREPTLHYHHEQWEREHQRSLEAHPPTFIVTRDDLHADARALRSSDYRAAGRFDSLLLFQQVHAAPVSWIVR